jgi:hypothetical protein
MAARALLERGDPASASAATATAIELAKRDDLRALAHRTAGWVGIARTNLTEAREHLEKARALAEGEPRGQADATAGLGIVTLLGGDPVAARSLLEEALAIHVVMRDAPRELAVRGMMNLLPDGDIVVDHLAGEVSELRAKGQRWREALALARLALDARAKGDASTERQRLFEARAAAMLSNMPAAKLVRSLVESDSGAKPFVVASDGRELTLPSGDKHDLGRHGALRRLLWALAIARRDRPGTPMNTAQMIDAGWPGEKMRHEAATLRVYTTVRRLRAIGLGDALITRDDGYLLDTDVSFTIA